MSNQTSGTPSVYDKCVNGSYNCFFPINNGEFVICLCNFCQFKRYQSQHDIKYVSNTHNGKPIPFVPPLPLPNNEEPRTKKRKYTPIKTGDPMLSIDSISSLIQIEPILSIDSTQLTISEQLVEFPEKYPICPHHEISGIFCGCYCPLCEQYQCSKCRPYIHYQYYY